MFVKIGQVSAYNMIHFSAKTSVETLVVVMMEIQSLCHCKLMPSLSH